MILWIILKVIKLKKVGQFNLINQEHKLRLEVYYGQAMLDIIELILMSLVEFIWEVVSKSMIYPSYYDSLIDKIINHSINNTKYEKLINIKFYQII